MKCTNDLIFYFDTSQRRIISRLIYLFIAKGIVD